MATQEQAAPGMSDEAVRAKTGKSWSQWFAILDKAKAKDLPHKEITELLRGKHGVPPWWSQMVTVGYEQERGLRVKHQKCDGFSVSGSKTVAVSVAPDVAVTRGKKTVPLNDLKAKDHVTARYLATPEGAKAVAFRVAEATPPRPAPVDGTAPAAGN